MTTRVRPTLRFLAGWAMSTTLCASCDDGPRAVVERDGGVVLDVPVEVARDEAARRMGLRGRALGPSEGLWLAFPAESEVCLVNDGVSFDVAALFISRGQVAAVTTLRADDGTPRCELADAVLELRSGDEADARAGDQVHLFD